MQRLVIAGRIPVALSTITTGLVMTGCALYRATTPIHGPLPQSPPSLVAVVATSTATAASAAGNSLPTLRARLHATQAADSEAASATASAAIGTAWAMLPGACQLYDPEPSHLWNRLHCLLHLRVGPNGTFYGLDELDTLHWANSRHLIDSPSYDRASALLDQFVATSGERLIDDPVRRAILQRDLWAIFDWLDIGIRIGSENGQSYDRLRRERLQSRLVSVMRRIALSRHQIDELPDNYTQAAQSGNYAQTVQLSECHNCHASPGARSIQSYSREVSGAGPLPGGLVASTVAEEAAIMAGWKVRQPEWERMAALWR